MSVYSVKGKGWRYDFTLKGERYTDTWFKTKKTAQAAEAKRREEIENPKPEMEEPPTDISFLELVNLRLDYVKAYQSEVNYRHSVYMARRWIARWKDLNCSRISDQMVQALILERSKTSAYTANKELRYLRATFNFGIKKKLVHNNPTKDIDFLPVEKAVKYIPPADHIDKVIAMADVETQDYLFAIRETMARMNEINQLTWDDVDLQNRCITLYTRKKKGGHRTPRKVPMTQRLFEILSRRSATRREDLPWVFWHKYWSASSGRVEAGPFQDRKKIMRILCEKAGVRYFRFHALRHSGASIMDQNGVPLGSIQRILGHENRKTTEIYLHSIGDSERHAIEVYERATKNSHTNSHT
ncbi:MAG: site-specific integrase [Desulfobacteraceae bacterium]|nr:site-specific integrase [Desulfobacteraceae bacterium]